MGPASRTRDSTTLCTFSWAIASSTAATASSHPSAGTPPAVWSGWRCGVSGRGRGPASAAVMVVMKAPSASRPTTSSGTISTDPAVSSGSKAKLANATKPVPGRSSGSLLRVWAASVSKAAWARAQRCGPVPTGSRAASPTPTNPPSRCSHANGCSPPRWRAGSTSAGNATVVTTRRGGTSTGGWSSATGGGPAASLRRGLTGI